jgi:hypothetical protein
MIEPGDVHSTGKGLKIATKFRAPKPLDGRVAGNDRYICRFRPQAQDVLEIGLQIDVEQDGRVVSLRVALGMRRWSAPMISIGVEGNSKSRLRCMKNAAGAPTGTIKSSLRPE